MVARRLILAMLVLLVMSSILAALVPVERDRLDDTSTSSTTAPEPASTTPEGELVRRTIAADDASPEPIELALGDQLELVVTAGKRADQVEIPAFGMTADVDPDFPARFDVLALETGRFAVRLVEAERTIARIVVAAPKRKSGEPAGEQKGRQRGGQAAAR